MSAVASVAPWPAVEVAPSEPLLVATGVRKADATSRTDGEVVRGVDLTIQSGDLVMVVGPSRRANTTLLDCLSGLGDIDAGRVLVHGEDIHAMSDARRAAHRARHMGFVFRTVNLVPLLTAVENVELPLLMAGTRPPAARRRAVDALERVGLGGRGGDRPSLLSDGEQLRAAVARALAAGPDVVWVDDPTVGLDSETAASLLDLLGDVHAAGSTVVVLTLDEAIGSAGTRLVRFADGHIVLDGVPVPP